MSYVMGLYHQLINHRGLQPRFFKIQRAKKMWKKFPYLIYAELISVEIGATFKMKLFGKEKFILAYSQANDMKIQWLVSSTSAKEPKEQHKLQLRIRQEKYVESKAKLAQNIYSINTILSQYSCLVSPFHQPLNQENSNQQENFPLHMEIPRKEELSESDNETLAVTQNNDYKEENNGEGKRPVKQNKENVKQGIKEEKQPVKQNNENEKQSIKEENEKRIIKEEKQSVKQNKGANREIKLVTKEEKRPVKQNEERGKDEMQPVKQLSDEKQSVMVEKKLNEISTQNGTSKSSNAKTNMKKIQAQVNAKTNMKKIQAQYDEPQLPDPYENDVNAKTNIYARYNETQFPDSEEQTTYHNKPKIVKRQIQKKPVSYIKKKPIGSPTYN